MKFVHKFCNMKAVPGQITLQCSMILIENLNVHKILKT